MSDAEIKFAQQRDRLLGAAATLLTVAVVVMMRM